MTKTPDPFCPDKHHQKGRFIEACVLCLLREEPCYGYSLMEKLNLFGFDKNSVSISVIYRNLHDMERRGLVSSSWTASEQGPKKRIYAITPGGEKALDNWISLLQDRKKRIMAIIDKYQSTHKA
ncbi:MAG: PadR family transcriptional regulator [Bacillota bacterium]